MPHRYLMYLRKSRKDNPDETVEEVLAKHETQLQEYARRELGGAVPAENIYREVVSGESIDDRVEIKKIMSRIEEPDVLGVVVMEPSRLSRGDLSDCARIIDSFRFTHSLILTPYMAYDLEKKMERKFFQDELLRGKDYLEYTKEILLRGRIAAVKRGCYIARRAPYGYDRIKIGRDWTLTPNGDADTVRLIFRWFVDEGLTAGAIARRLEELGYPAQKGGTWKACTVLRMLGNVHYNGQVRWFNTKNVQVMEYGERKTKTLKQRPEDVLIAEGKQPAIIDPKTWAAAQERLAGLRSPRTDHTKLVNVLSGVLRCAKCGKVLVLENRRGASARYNCRTKPRCLKSTNAERVETAVVYALEHAELPALKAKLQNGEGDAAVIQKRRIEALSKTMEGYRDQEEKQYELLETGKYTQAVFDRRNASLRAKMDACEKELHLARAALPKSVDYAERIVTLEEAISAMKDKSLPNAERNRILRGIVDRVELSTTDHGLGKTDIHLEVFLRL